MQSWHPLEHKIWSEIQEYRKLVQEKRILLAVSGGRDSMVLAKVLYSLAKPLHLEMALAFVDHGSGQKAEALLEQREFRAKAKVQVAQLAKQQELPFFSLGPSERELTSEEEMRDFRYQELRACADNHGYKWLVLGHHAQDQLETRLIRLIRGTGINGLQAMSTLDQDLWRPFLNCSERELEQYASQQAVDFLQDPSNQDVRFLRNWLRQQWLPQLEVYRAGAVETLAASLENISQASLGSSVYDFSNGIPWVEFLQLGYEQQCQLLANYLYSLDVRGFRRGQIEEIIKRLDNSQKVHSFKLAQCLWTIDANCVKAERF